jgi:hypothetical protein
MEADSAKVLTAFGFLTVCQSADHGLFGGYLVLSPQGRPLEFRCSEPIQASRAQEILYGPTLRPYLFSEIIGQALVAGSSSTPPIILVDEPDLLPLAQLRREPVALVESLDVSEPAQAVKSEASRPPASAGAIVVEIGVCRVTAPAEAGCTAEQLLALLEPLAAHVTLDEPFDRIRAALAEAQLATGDAAEELDERAAA